MVKFSGQNRWLVVKLALLGRVQAMPAAPHRVVLSSLGMTATNEVCVCVRERERERREGGREGGREGRGVSE